MVRFPTVLVVLFATVCLVGACSHARAPRPSAPPAPVIPGQWSYEIAIGSGGKELAVEAAFPPTGYGEFEVGFGAAPYIRELEVLVGSSWNIVPSRDEFFLLPACATSGCRIRYRVAIDEAAKNVEDQDVAIDLGGAYEAPPGTWLVRPARSVAGTRVRFHVETSGGSVFMTGIPALTPGAYEGAARDILEGPYAVFGDWHPHRLEIAGGSLEVAVSPAKFRLNEDEIVAWVHDAADDVARYFGSFPPGRALVIVAPTAGGRVNGTTMGSGGAAVLMRLGTGLTKESAKGGDHSWVLTHELIHLCFPSLGPPHSWMEEGLATYLEPVVRARSADIDTETFWRDLVLGLPQGLPRRGDRGLEQTHTWGRTYWGGALFWLLADLAIRERSGNKRSLDDVLRAVVAAGGTVGTQWDIERVLQVGDTAAGSPVLRELYDRLARAPGGTDLQGLWKRLGVEVRAGAVTFNEAAPLSQIRRAITRVDARSGG